MEATVTGPFPVAAKADKPAYKVIVRRGEYVDHHTFEATDGGASSKDACLAKAQAFAAGAVA